MRQLFVTFALAGTLSIPSLVFAEATWYGTLRAGVESSDGNIAVKDGDSHWGIMGSAEAGEGLTVVYRFEHGISTENASQPDGRLSYVGLSGGFGTLTVGRIWNAAYNAVGVITDNSMHYGDSETTYRHGPAISYAFSNDLFSLQFDALYGGEEGLHTDPDNDLQSVEFGLSVNVGEIGKVAVAYTDDKYYRYPPAFNVGGTWRNKLYFTAAEVTVSDLTVYAGTRKLTGYDTSSEQLGMIQPQKTKFFGFRGGLGDTGIKYLFQYRDVTGTPALPQPWVFGLSKSLGGGASINFEHANNDTLGANESRVNLTVDF